MPREPSPQWQSTKVLVLYSGLTFINKYNMNLCKYRIHCNRFVLHLPSDGIQFALNLSVAARKHDSSAGMNQYQNDKDLLFIHFETLICFST